MINACAGFAIVLRGVTLALWETVFPLLPRRGYARPTVGFAMWKAWSQ